jgi:Uri superfamily endonuclease
LKMQLPKIAGSYILFSQLMDLVTVQVGHLGKFNFPAGWYIYSGSARGGGGIRARVERHMRKDKKMHWHMDYLRPFLQLQRVGFVISPQDYECRLNRIALDFEGAMVNTPGFGASDCQEGCPSHLVYFHSLPIKPFIRKWQETRLEDIHLAWF